MPDSPRTPSPEPADHGQAPTPAVPRTPSARDAAVMAEFDRATREQETSGEAEPTPAAGRRGLFRRRPATPGAADPVTEVADTPEPEPTPEAEVEPEATPEALAEPEAQRVDTAAAEPEAAAEDATVPSEPEVEVDVEPEVDAAPGLEATPGAEAAPATTAEQDPEPAVAVEVEPEPEATTREHPVVAAAPPTTDPVTPGTATPGTAPESAPPGDDSAAAYSVRTMLPVLLLRAAHPRRALITALVMGIVAALAGRPGNEALLVLATVLVGQVVLGWHNDAVDAERDARQQPDTKPVAQGLLDRGTLWFAIACGALVLVPLAVANGLTSAAFYLGSVLVGLIGNVALRHTVFSWLSWAASFALLVPFLTYGGLGGQAVGSPPEPLVVGLAALLGIGVHVLSALPGLVGDNAEGSGSLPLLLALRTGAPKLLVITGVYLTVVTLALVVVGLQVGLAR